MGSLKDGLLRAGLVSKKQTVHAERTQRAKRTKRKRAGEVDPELLRQQAAREERALRLAAEEAARVAKRHVERAEHERRVQVHNLVRRPKGGDTRPGQRAFHFLQRGGRIGRLWVTGAVGGLLDSGHAAVLEDPFEGDDRFQIVDRDAAERVLRIDPTWVRFYNGHPDHAGLPLPADDGS